MSTSKRPLVGPVTAVVCTIGFILGVLLLAMGLDSTARAGGLPPSPLRIYPAVCEVPYALQGGERAVLVCDAPVPRGGLEGIVQFASGHESVDVSLIAKLHRGTAIFAVSNRSADPVNATARGEQW